MTTTPANALATAEKEHHDATAEADRLRVEQKNFAFTVRQTVPRDRPALKERGTVLAEEVRAVEARMVRATDALAFARAASN